MTLMAGKRPVGCRSVLEVIQAERIFVFPLKFKGNTLDIVAMSRT